MKKLLALLLCLLLYVPAALSETSEIELTTRELDFGDFVMTIFNLDAVDMREKLDGEAWAIIYPLYAENAPFHDTINVVWYEADLTETVDAMGAEVYAQLLLETILEQYALLGIATDNATLNSVQYDEGQMAMAYTVDMDYSGAGTDLQVTMYQMQYYVMLGEAGTYSFTLTADSFEDLELLSYYLTATAFPAAE